MRVLTNFRALVACALALAAWLSASEAEAYPWMIRHEYTTCLTCHTDPSGGGLLTPYGRAQASLLLSSPLGLPKDEEEPGKYKDFLFGAMTLPEWMDAQAWARSAGLVNLAEGDVQDSRVLLMRLDGGLNVRAGMFRASGMLGAASPDSRPLTQEAWITSSLNGWNLVSREHWAGVAVADEAVLIRAGRLNVPFGIRNVEHTFWVRRETRTDTNQQQQHGVAASYSGESLRGEAMAILGNYQIRPDAYRERGYAAFAEYAFEPEIAVGVSSSIVHADADIALRRPFFRQSHGVFARAVPWKPLVLMAEVDLLIKSIKNDNPSYDVTGLLQADYEPIRGLHLVGAGEVLTDARTERTLLGGWFGVWYFLFAHMDARVDVVHRTDGSSPSTTTFLFQLHGWL